MTTRKPKRNSTLACGCRVHLTDAEINAWFRSSEARATCPSHGEQKIASTDGPEALAKMFRF